MFVVDLFCDVINWLWCFAGYCGGPQGGSLTERVTSCQHPDPRVRVTTGFSIILVTIVVGMKLCKSREMGTKRTIVWKVRDSLESARRKGRLGQM